MKDRALNTNNSKDQIESSHESGDGNREAKKQRIREGLVDSLQAKWKHFLRFYFLLAERKYIIYAWNRESNRTSTSVTSMTVKNKRLKEM
uniref:Ovule protein n=1 Tax=Steinernema glaseri TaxID=37863 RepID=A0A1I8AR54_9BILA